MAQNAGRSVAKLINDPSAKPVQFTPVFWSMLGAPLRYCGNTANGFDDDVIIKGDMEKPSLLAYYTHKDEVVAVASLGGGQDPAVMQAAELMVLGKMPSRSQVQDGINLLEIDLKA